MKYFLGIAAGTLLYVVMFEVLNRERMKEVSGLLQLVGVLLGFGVMLLIEIFGNIYTVFISGRSDSVFSSL